MIEIKNGFLFYFNSIKISIISKSIFRNITGENIIIALMNSDNVQMPKFPNNFETSISNNLFLANLLSENEMINIQNIFGNIKISSNLILKNIMLKSSIIFLQTLQGIVLKNCSFYSNLCNKGTIYYDEIGKIIVFILFLLLNRF